jgi:hypothetical protein
MRACVTVAAGLFLSCISCSARAQTEFDTARANAGGVVGVRLQNAANGILGMLSYTIVPGAAASSLQLNRNSTGKPNLTMGQIGSGFTIDPSFPLYMEGYLGYARYDPKFVFSDGEGERSLPTRWNSIVGMVGIGWDFQLNEHWVLRPIISGNLGYVASDAELTGFLLQRRTNIELKFLERGHLNAIGAGGSLVLGYYIAREAYEFDMELRSTSLFLTSFGDTAQAVRGRANSLSASLWTRLRWPTGYEIFGRPLRYVVEGTHSELFADQARALGFNRITSVGGGLEVDVGGLRIGAFGLEAQRLRVTGNFFFGPGVSGASIQLGISL